MRTVDNNGHAVDYTFDKAARLTATKDATGITRYRYDGAGNQIQVISPNGWATNYGYDQANRLKSVTEGTATTWLKYDATGT